MQQIWLSSLEDKYYRLKEMLWQKLIFTQCQFMEFSSLVFVAIVTALPRQQKIL